METLSLKDFLKASLFASLILPNICNAQQETLDISKEHFQEWNKTYPRIFNVSYRQVDNSKNAYIVTNQIGKNQEFIGQFLKLPETYKLAMSSSQQFVVNELVNNISGIQSYRLSDLDYLILKANNDSLYAISERDMITLNDIKTQSELISIVNKLGYKEYRDGEDFYIKSKTSQIRLDARTHSELKKNSNYISLLDADQAKIATLVKQTISHSKTLDQYLSQHRIQKSKMPTASINAWRTATANAQKLMEQINKLSEKYDGNYSFKLLNKSSSLDIFSDNLLASKGVLRR